MIFKRFSNTSIIIDHCYQTVLIVFWKDWYEATVAVPWKYCEETDAVSNLLFGKKRSDDIQKTLVLLPQLTPTCKNSFLQVSLNKFFYYIAD